MSDHFVRFGFVDGRNTLSQRDPLNRPLLGAAVASALFAAALAFYIAARPYIPADAAVERDMQSVNWEGSS